MSEHAPHSRKDAAPAARHSDADRAASGPLAEMLNRRSGLALGPIAQLLASRGVVQRSSMGDSEEYLGRVRSGTRLQTLGNRDPRTRGGAEAADLARRAGRELPERNLALEPYRVAADGTRLWDGFTRFSWNFEDDAFYADKGVNVDGRTLYPCLTGPGTFTNLPRQSDKQAGDPDHATIGHIVQWRDYILANVDPEEFEVQGGRRIRAYPRDAAFAAYIAPANLRLEGSIYNSTSSARAYGTDPLHQALVQG